MTLLSQVSTSYPRVPRDSFCPDTGVFSYLLSGYGQFILPASFLPLHGYWSLHFDLCPSHFHTCSGILFRIIPALFLSFRIYCIFCLKGKSGLSLLISFPSRQAYNPAYSGTSRIHYPVHFFQNAGTGPLLSYQYLLPRLYRTGLWSCGSVYADNPFSGFVFFHGTWQLSFSAAHNCGFLYTSRQFTLLPCQPFFISSEESCFFKFNLFWKHCHPLHRIINPQYFGIAVIFICCLVFAAVSFIQQTCKILSGRLHTDCHWFQTAVFCRLPVFFHGDPF